MTTPMPLNKVSAEVILSMMYKKLHIKGLKLLKKFA